MDYVVKVLFFIPFMGLVYVVIDYFKSLLLSAMTTVPFSSVLCQFGVYDGLSVFFTILISAFAVKQAVSFMK
ncbi:MAG: hypothetical protein NTW78_09130 [Campylobacterales bacterium]|nr:hypothetical protein [Campylobacterales bacterium]